MFYSRGTNNKINRLHERAISFVYDDYSSSFDVLLKQDKSFTIHHYIIQTLCIELYKVYNNLSQTVFSELFTKKKKIHTIYVLNLILPFQKFIKVLIHFVILD